MLRCSVVYSLESADYLSASHGYSNTNIDFQLKSSYTRQTHPIHNFRLSDQFRPMQTPPTEDRHAPHHPQIPHSIYTPASTTANPDINF